MKSKEDNIRQAFSVLVQSLTVTWDFKATYGRSWSPLLAL